MEAKVPEKGTNCGQLLIKGLAGAGSGILIDFIPQNSGGLKHDNPSRSKL
jgi:hypothetical protein